MVKIHHLFCDLLREEGEEGRGGSRKGVVWERKGGERRWKARGKVKEEGVGEGGIAWEGGSRVWKGGGEKGG